MPKRPREETDSDASSDTSEEALQLKPKLFSELRTYKRRFNVADISSADGSVTVSARGSGAR